MTEPETLLDPAPETAAETQEAPHSWDPAGRKIPAAKLDWAECLPFRQVRGIEVAPDPEHPFSHEA